jgi:hypothetical protein
MRREARRWAVFVLTLLLSLGEVGRAHAYQTYGVSVGEQVVTLKWATLPFRYYVTDQDAPGVSAAQVRDSVGRAFVTWESVATAAVSAEFVGFTSAEPGDDDGQNTLGFRSRPDLDGVLGATDYLIDDTTGAIIEADTFFNTTYAWSVAPAGEAGKFDLDSIALHETGHVFGLGHSDLGETELLAGGGRRVVAAEAVMFPIAYSAGVIAGRTVRADDIAGLSALYPRGSFLADSGGISGRVTKDGQGVFGAHVVAFNPATGALVGNLSLDTRGSFAIMSLAPGPYILRVEPLDDVDLDSFFGDADIPLVDLDFRVGYCPQLVIVPRGGFSQSVEVAVVAK